MLNYAYAKNLFRNIIFFNYIFNYCALEIDIVVPSIKIMSSVNNL
jgi:hypothetical protein